MFFDDPGAFDLLKPRAKAVSEQYPEWEEHSSGMNQFIVWTALEAEGLGANLQHYQPGITPYIQKKFDVPETWRLKSQLVFGGRIGPLPEAKPKTHLESAVRVHGA
jgi:uncharacterized protein